MSNQRSYIALNWVTQEIIETLDQASSALQAYITTPTDITKLRFCLTYIHQVTGGLIMVELHPASVLSKNIEALIAHIITQTDENHSKLIKAIQHAIDVLADYIQQVNTTHQSDTQALLESINQIRSLLLLDTVTPADMFNPNIAAARVTKKQKPRMTEKDFGALIHKLDKAYLHALNHLNNQFEIEKNINLLNKIAASLYKVSKSTVSEPLWHIVLAIVEYLQQYPSELNEESLKALRLSYQEVLALKQTGVNGLSFAPSSQLLKNLLYSVAITENTTDHIAHLRQQYQLDEALSASKPKLEPALEEKTFKNFIDATLSLANNIEYSTPIAIARAMSLLQTSIGRMHSLQETPSVEGFITELLALQINHEQQQNFFTSYRQFIQTSHQQVVSIKEQFVAYINSGFNAFHLQGLPQALFQQAQSLYLSTTHELSPILLAAHDYVLQLDEHPSDNTSLELLANAISAAEYFLECLLAESPVQLANIIANANSCVEQLGFTDKLQNFRLLANNSSANNPAESSAIALEAAEKSETAEQHFVLSAEVDEEILDIFIEEAGEVLDEIQQRSPELKANLQNTEALLDLRRCFHTLKGSGRMVGAEHIADMAWAIEDLLNKQRDGVLAVNIDTITLIQLAAEHLPEMLSALKQRQAYPLNLVAYITAQTARIAQGLACESFSAYDTALEEENDEVQHAHSELHTIFIAEAETHIQAFADFLDSISPGYEDSYISSELQRALHTLKGSAYMANIENMASVATVLESFIKDMANFQCVVDAEMLTLLIRSCQALEQLLASLREGRDEAIDKQEEFLDDIKQMHQERLANHETQAEENNALADKYTSLLSQALDTMTDAASLLMLWQSEGLDDERQSELYEAVNKLAATAQAANYPTIATIAAALANYYQHAIHHSTFVDGKFFELANRAQEELEDILDIIAAQQTAELDQALLTQLEQAISSDEITTETESNLSQQPVDLSAKFDVIHSQSTHASPPDEPSNSDMTAPIAQLLEELKQADEELLEIFTEELADLCEQLDSNAQACLSEQQITQDNLDQLKRTLHTIKGGARMAELASLGDIAHQYESMLEKAEAQQLFNQEFFSKFANYQQQLMLLSDAVFSPQAAASNIETKTVEASQTIEQAPIAVAQTKVASHDEQAETSADIETGTAVESLSPSAQFLQSLSGEIRAADPETIEIFTEELSELVASLDEALIRCVEQQKADALKRILHTIKGGARMAELPSLGDFSHEFESFVEAYEGQGFDSVKEEIYQFLDQLQLMAELLIAGDTEAGNALPETADTQEEAQTLSDDQADEILPSTPSSRDESSSANTNIIPIRKDIDFSNVSQAAIEATRKFIDSFNQEQQRSGKRESIRIAPELLEDLINLAGENIIARSRLEEQMSELHFSLDEMDTTVDRLHAQLRRLEIETEAQITFRQEQVNIEGLENFDPLEMDRYSQMQQLSKSLIEAASDIDDLSATFTHKMRDIDTLILQQARVNTDLQEGLMRFQMVPFARMVPRLRRIVRQIAQELGKQVQLEVENAEGELDRTILEKMIAPLEHMLRNAVDHGIELPEVRKQLGKPEMGTITIHLSREGGEVILKLSDDGAGINLEAVRNKAIERGLLSTDAHISDHETMQFILSAGFSTATKVTQISGRGVGMDVVNSEIKQIGGSISVDSSMGLGSRFTVRLPFTVSINRALMVSIGSDTFAIPLTSIEGIVRVSPYELEAYYQPNAPLFDYAGQSYHLRYLGSLLNRGSAKMNEVLTPLPVILIRSSDYSVAVQVDRLLGSKEIVVKSLGPQFSMVQGLNGATVLGDGSVVVILDMMALIRSDISRGLLNESDAIAAKETQVDDRADKATHVMVVDDSVTVRKVTSRLLERYDLEVSLARDGLDAITQLQETENLPDILLLDIEMPRMDGFEVLSRLRHNERLKHIPVVMITSRTGDKHRERALSLGANRYLGKPFQESELLSVIGELTKTEILLAL